jgi:thioredoxin reductase (NADPH)
MAKPVLVVVDDEEVSRQALTEELESRYGRHYQIVSAGSPDAALARLEELRAEGAPVPLVLADQWMPGMTGTQFLARVKQVISTARRGLLISWGDRSAVAPILEAAALGWLEFYLPKPAWSPDEQFHRRLPNRWRSGGVSRAGGSRRSR